MSHFTMLPKGGIERYALRTLLLTQFCEHLDAVEFTSIFGVSPGEVIRAKLVTKKYLSYYIAAQEKGHLGLATYLKQRLTMLDAFFSELVNSFPIGEG